MYREESWSEGLYFDNHEKYECLSCWQSFIIGKNLLKASNRKTPICPYCGSIYTDSDVGSDDSELPELSDDLGCLGIYFHPQYSEKMKLLSNMGR